MKKTILTGCLLVSCIGVIAQDTVDTNPPPPAPSGEMQTDAVTNTATPNPPPSEPPPAPPAQLAPVDNPPPPQPSTTPIDTAPAPVVTAPAATTTTTYSTPPPAQPLYTTSRYRPATDTDHRFGAGIILGEPTGVSLKYWLSDQTAVDGAFGFTTWDHAPFYIHADMLWHKFDLINISPASGKLPVYFGVGGLLRFRNDGRSNDVGIRVPFGVDYLFDNLPVDVFAEIAPVIGVAPDFHGELTGGIGVRFWF